MANNTTILVVDDDKDLTDYLKEILKEQGFIVDAHNRGAKVMDAVEKINPNLVILDLHLPDISGEALCKQIKTHFPQIPVIILTASDDTSSVVRNLNSGADDYITKPFETEELLARVRTRLKTNQSQENLVQVRDIILDLNTKEVKKGKDVINLSVTEFELLYYLMKNKNIVCTREMILNHVWAYSPDTESRVVDVYIGYLRKKLDYGDGEKLINSKRGFGYFIKDQPERGADQ